MNNKTINLSLSLKNTKVSHTQHWINFFLHYQSTVLSTNHRSRTTTQTPFHTPCALHNYPNDWRTVKLVAVTCTQGWLEEKGPARPTLPVAPNKEIDFQDYPVTNTEALTTAEIHNWQIIECTSFFFCFVWRRMFKVICEGQNVFLIEQQCEALGPHSLDSVILLRFLP